LAQAIYRELMEGRGSPRGAVFADVTAARQEDIEKGLTIGNLHQIIKGMGIDLKKDTIEVGVASHFLMGGMKTGPHGETNLPGLLAGGEAMAGIHGGNRLGGNALSEILVTGARAGEEAGRLASRQKGNLPPVPAKTEWEEWIAGLLARPRAGLVPGDLKKSLQDCMWKHAGVIRTGANLKKGLEVLKGLQIAMEKEMALSYGPRAYHMELQDAVEVRLMLDLARCILTAADRREESRGAQWRDDFPETKEDWRANLVLTKDKDEIVCEKKRR
jgi:fumarate reductase (CoM/CoB) subunit A